MFMVIFSHRSHVIACFPAKGTWAGLLSSNRGTQSVAECGHRRGGGEEPGSTVA